MNELPFFSVVIVSWNVRELLISCLKSIYEKTAERSYEIILIDNNSSDGTQEAVRKYFPGVKFIENRENLGFGGACNIGAGAASGKYLFFLNPDTELKDKALDKLIEFMEKNSEISAAGAKLLWPDGSYQDSYKRFFSVFFSVLEIFEFHYYFPQNRLNRAVNYNFKIFPRPAEVDWVIGAAFAVRRDFFEKVGGFDAGFFMYSEEIDLCRRIRSQGGKIFFYPFSEIVHHKGKSSQTSNVRSVDYYKSLYYYHFKHSGKAKSFFFRMALSLWTVFYVSVVFLKYLFSGDCEKYKVKIKNKLLLLKWSLFL